MLRGESCPGVIKDQSCYHSRAPLVHQHWAVMLKFVCLLQNIILLSQIINSRPICHSQLLEI